MVVVTTKDSNVILALTNTTSPTVNEGYTRIDDCRFIVKASGYNFHEVEEVPSGVVAYRYCYTTEKGFYENPDWEEIKPVILITDAQKDLVVDEIRQEVKNGTNTETN